MTPQEKAYWVWENFGQSGAQLIPILAHLFAEIEVLENKHKEEAQ